MLRWENHIDLICKKASADIGAIRRINCLYRPIHYKFYIMLLFNHTLIILLPSGIPVERVSETNEGPGGKRA